MAIPYLKIVLALMSFCTALVGSLINIVEPCLPTFIKQVARYGKFSYKGPTENSILKPVQVPKRWFKHFYVFAAFYTTFVTALAFMVYCGKADVPLWFQDMLNFMLTNERKNTVSSGHALVALMLLTAQSWRRFYETFCISVFSNSRIDISHYILGYIHYYAAATTIIAEAPIFAASEKDAGPRPEEGLTVGAVIAVGVFLWAFVHQYRAAVILANLRKDEKGQVVNTEHRIPTGDWFQWVSSPHILAEILMYIALTVLTCKNSGWHYVLTWVVCNQVETALLSHWWYKDTFKNYPDSRKALIPFIL